MSQSFRIPFNRPFMSGKELAYIAEAHANGALAGDGPFTRRCHAWLEQRTGTNRALLTHSCTAALEMAALLADLAPGDEVIMPSFTFVSTANAFVLRGGVPVFVDIRPDTLNLDETKIEAEITKRTKAIVPVHYAGIACDMDPIASIAMSCNAIVIEDAAQGILASYKGRSLGSLGHMGCLSFHETKNVISGEGGALLINDPGFAHRAEIIREKGTNRTAFFRGEIDKYTWVDIGSSYLPSEIVAAFLYAQLETANQILAARMNLWNSYHRAFAELEADGYLRRPVVPTYSEHNAHMYYLLLPNAKRRDELIEGLRTRGISAVFHYVPLHSSPAGQRYGRSSESLEITEDISKRIIRLPLWLGLDVDVVINAVRDLVLSGRGI